MLFSDRICLLVVRLFSNTITKSSKSPPRLSSSGLCLWDVPFENILDYDAQIDVRPEGSGSLVAWHFILSLSSVKVFGEWKLCRCRCCCHNLLHASLIAMNNKINGVKKGTHSIEVTRCCLFIMSISVWFKGLINIRHIVYTVKVIKEMGWNSMFMKITLDEIQQGINDAKLIFELLNLNIHGSLHRYAIMIKKHGSIILLRIAIL